MNRANSNEKIKDKIILIPYKEKF